MNFLQEDNGNYSSQRVAMLASVFGGIFLAYVGIVSGSDLVGLTTLVGVIVGAGVGGKVIQKGKEK